MNNFLANKNNLDIILIVSLISVFLIVFIIFAIYSVFKTESKTSEVSVTIQNQVSNLSYDENTYISHNADNENDVEVVYIETIPENETVYNDESLEDLKNVTGTSPYYIRVNYKANVVTIYKKDNDGFYTVPFKAMICSCGTATPKSGTYETSSKYRWLSLVGNVNGQYSTRIVNRILFHSVPYLKKTNDSLEYWEYDKLGTSASAGCIRLTVEDAKWIYDNCDSGTKVEFYSSDNPGPLGKPEAKKISSNEECRNWDPTDPHSENPWNK